MIGDLSNRGISNIEVPLESRDFNSFWLEDNIIEPGDVKMHDPFVILRQKEQQLEQVRREFSALMLVVTLVAEPSDVNDKHWPLKNPYLEMFKLI